MNEQTGKKDNVCFCPGFLRGMTICDGHAIATVSLPRDGTFKDLELEENVRKRGGVPWCGIQIVDLRTGSIVEWIRLEGFIKELFDVGVVGGSRCPMALGVGTPEIQHTISFEPDFGPLSLDSMVQRQAEERAAQNPPQPQPTKELAKSA